MVLLGKYLTQLQNTVFQCKFTVFVSKNTVLKVKTKFLKSKNAAAKKKNFSHFRVRIKVITSWSRHIFPNYILIQLIFQFYKRIYI